MFTWPGTLRLSLVLSAVAHRPNALIENRLGALVLINALLVSSRVHPPILQSGESEKSAISSC